MYISLTLTLPHNEVIQNLKIVCNPNPNPIVPTILMFTHFLHIYNLG